MSDSTALKLALALHRLTPKERERARDVVYELLRLRDLEKSPRYSLTLGGLRFK